MDRDRNVQSTTKTIDWGNGLPIDFGAVAVIAVFSLHNLTRRLERAFLLVQLYRIHIPDTIFPYFLLSYFIVFLGRCWRAPPRSRSPTKYCRMLYHTFRLTISSTRTTKQEHTVYFGGLLYCPKCPMPWQLLTPASGLDWSLTKHVLGGHYFLSSSQFVKCVHK